LSPLVQRRVDLQEQALIKLKQMKKAGPALRTELDSTWYLEAHPEVADFFKQAGCFTYCEKLQSFHRQVSEVFALSYDDRKAIIGKEEFIVDEASASRSKPTRSQNINQLLRRVYDLEIFEKQIKKRNVESIDKNVELYDNCQDVMEKHDKTLDRNKTLMKHRKFKSLALYLKDDHHQSSLELS
jgi:hypothetical protein